MSYNYFTHYMQTIPQYTRILEHFEHARCCKIKSIWKPWRNINFCHEKMHLLFWNLPLLYPAITKKQEDASSKQAPMARHHAVCDSLAILVASSLQNATTGHRFVFCVRLFRCHRGATTVCARITKSKLDRNGRAHRFAPTVSPP